MNDILSDTKGVLLWLFGVIGTLLGILGAIAMNILRSQIKRIDKLEAEVVRKQEFEQLRADLRDEHEENSEKLDKLAELIERNNEQAADSRNRLANQMLDLVGKVGTLQGRVGIDEFARRESGGN